MPGPAATSSSYSAAPASQQMPTYGSGSFGEHAPEASSVNGVLQPQLVTVPPDISSTDAMVCQLGQQAALYTVSCPVNRVPPGPQAGALGSSGLGLSQGPGLFAGLSTAPPPGPSAQQPINGAFTL
jgi:hypothetical protein